MVHLRPLATIGKEARSIIAAPSANNSKRGEVEIHDPFDLVSGSRASNFLPPPPASLPARDLRDRDALIGRTCDETFRVVMIGGSKVECPLICREAGSAHTLSESSRADGGSERSDLNPTPPGSRGNDLTSTLLVDR